MLKTIVVTSFCKLLVSLLIVASLSIFAVAKSATSTGSPLVDTPVITLTVTKAPI